MHYGERLNSITHFLGGAIALLGVGLLDASALGSGNPAKVLASLVYGTAIVAMFLISTLYHSTRGERRVWLRKLDHVAIFVMIAGTYTPLCLLPLWPGVGPWLLATVWGLAVVGAILEFKVSHRTRLPSFALYFGMSFLALAAFPGLTAALPGGALAWIKGGLWLYGLGFVFYVLDKKFRDRHLHGIWHLFVIGGAFCHFVSIFEFVIRAR